MHVQLKKGRAIRGFLGHYPGTFPDALKVMTFDIQHGFTNDKGQWFTEFAVQSHGVWHNIIFYESDFDCSGAIQDDNDFVMHIKVKRIDENGAEFELIAEFDYKYQKGIFKKWHSERVFDGEIKLLKEYENNAYIQ